VLVQAFGSFDAIRHPRVAVLADGLRALGVQVDICNEPLRLTTADRVRVLMQPWRLPALAFKITRTWLRLVRKSRRLPTPDAVIVGYLGHFDVLLARWLYRGRPIINDMLIFAADTARDRGAGAVRQWALSRLDDAAVRASDLVLVDTEEHLVMLPPRAEGLVVPVGAAREWLGPQPEPRSGPLKVVFFGLYAPLQGAPIIGEAIPLLDERVTVTMVGTGQDLARTKQSAAGAANVVVRWLDWVDPQHLTTLVRNSDVCLGIFSADGKGTRVVPNKVYQGAAAGCAIVTSDTPPQRRALGDAAILIKPGDPAALAETLLALADDPQRLQEMRLAAWQLAKDQFIPEAVSVPLKRWLDEHATR
jgi:glycosyltransferase involved in cell wall biosynthesis